MSWLIHELGHAAFGGDGCLRRLNRNEWQYDPDTPPEGEAVVLAQLAGCVAERVVGMGANPARVFLELDPVEFFNTPCASEEDLIFINVDVDTCVRLAIKHDLIGHINHTLGELGESRLKAFARALSEVPIGGALRLELGRSLPGRSGRKIVAWAGCRPAHAKAKA